MAPENQHPPEAVLTERTLTETPPVPTTPPAVAKPVPEPTLEEAQALMVAATPEAHDVPPENRAIETTREAGEYVLPPPKPPKE